MPFTIEDVDKHNKGLDQAQKAQWVKVANSALKKCEDEGGSSCDATAITQANGVVKKLAEKETVNIKDVEIFQTGVWHGDKYTETDLDQLIESFASKGFEAPVKLGHNNEQEKDGQPSFGWIERVFKQGNKLLADLTDVPRKLAEAIERKQYRQVSSEIIWNFRPDMPRVLRAIALLGADIPEVKGLAPLDKAEIVFDDSEVDVRYSEINFKDKQKTKEPEDSKMEDSKKIEGLEAEVKTLTDALDAEKEGKVKELSDKTEKLDAVTKELSELKATKKTESIKVFMDGLKKEGKLMPAWEAKLHSVLESASDIVVCKYADDGKDVELSQFDIVKSLFDDMSKVVDFAEIGKEGNEDELAKNFTDKASAEVEIDRLIKLSMDKDSKLEYSDALNKVLDSNPKLKTVYIGE